MSKQADKTNKPAPPKAAKPKAPHIQQTPADSHLLQLAREDPARLTPTQRTHLQRTLGNRALGQWVGNPSSVNGEQSSSPAHPFTRSPGHPVTQSPSHLVIQPKLTVNAVGDKYEQEADAVAKEVVQKLNAPQPDAATSIPTAPPTHAQRQTEEEEPIAQRIQRQSAPHGAVAGLQTVPPALQRQEVPEEELQLQRQETEDEELQLQRQELEEEVPQEMAMLQREVAPEEDELQLQRQELQEEEEMQLQRQELEEDPAQLAMTQRQPQDFTHGGPVDSQIEAQINQSRGGGRPMEDSVRQPMEQAFGADFSDVCIHTDAQAHNLNEAIQARAFTTGNDVYFKDGEYSPNSLSGKELLAHELTHTVQQARSVQRQDGPQSFDSNYGKEEIDQTLLAYNRMIENVMFLEVEKFQQMGDLRWFFTYAHAHITSEINNNLSNFEHPNALLKLNIHFAEEFLRALYGQPHEIWQTAFKYCTSKQDDLLGAEWCGAEMAKAHINVDLKNALSEVGCVTPTDYGNMLVLVNRGSLSAIVELRGKYLGAAEAIGQYFAAPLLNLNVELWRNNVYEAVCNTPVPEPNESFTPLIQRQTEEDISQYQELKGENTTSNKHRPVEINAEHKHTDTQAHTLNEAIQARAFTTGNDIYFKQGEYNLASSKGQELLAHELTHNVQQSADSIHRKISSEYWKIRKNLTRGWSNLIITDEEAMEVFKILERLPTSDFFETINKMRRGDLYDRFLDNLPNKFTFLSLLDDKVKLQKSGDEIIEMDKPSSQQKDRNNSESATPEERIQKNASRILRLKNKMPPNVGERLSKLANMLKSSSLSGLSLVYLDPIKTNTFKKMSREERVHLIRQQGIPPESFIKNAKDFLSKPGLSSFSDELFIYQIINLDEEIYSSAQVFTEAALSGSNVYDSTFYELRDWVRRQQYSSKSIYYCYVEH